MGVLRSIEHRIESLVEGAFGRAFRSHVQPVELARKLAKEMDEHRTVSVSRVYVPNEYVLYLAPQDREQLPPEHELLTELGDYLSEHARREGYALVSAMHISASVFVNDHESGLWHDILHWLEHTVAPWDPGRYQHNDTGEDNAAAHLRSLTMGHEVIVPVTAGKLDLGPWQRVFYGEWDGQRRKRVVIKILGEK